MGVPFRVKASKSKFGCPNRAATICRSTPFTNACTTALKASPRTTATARSIRLPRKAKALNSSTTLMPLLQLGAPSRGCIPASPSGHSWAGFELQWSKLCGQRTRSTTESGASAALELGGDELRDVHQPAGVAPFVVVPAEHLHEVAVGHGLKPVEDARVRVADDVRGHDRVLGVLEDAAHARRLRALPKGVVDLLDGHLGVEVADEVRDRAIRHRDAQGYAVEPAL